MTAEIIRFPTNRIVRKWFTYVGRTPEAKEIDMYLRSVDRARDALLRQRQSLLMQWRAASARLLTEESTQ